MCDCRIVGRIILPCVRAARFATVACRNRRNVSHGKQVAVFPHDDSSAYVVGWAMVFDISALSAASPWRALHQVHVRLGTSCHRRGSRRRASTSRLQFVHGPIPAIAQHPAALWHPAYAAASAAGRPAMFSIAAVVEVLRLPNGTVGVIRSGKAGAISVDHAFKQRVRCETIGTLHTSSGAFSRPHRGRGCWLVRTGRCVPPIQ